MEAVAKTKYLKGSPRKARLVIDLIRGINVSRALSILKFTDKRAADPIAQCLSSAIANATYKAEQENIAIDPDDLWIKTCFVDIGPTKGRSRMRPAPQGRAYRERRHYCHITIQVTSEEKAKTEEQIRLEALRAERIAARKAAKAAEKAKTPVKKETKASKVEEEETTPIANVGDAVVETPTVEGASADETTDAAQDTPVETAAAEETAAVVEDTPVEVAATEEMVDSPVDETVDTTSADETAAEIHAEGTAEVADAKNESVQTPAALNETQPADEAQQKINEDLERQ